MVYLGASQFVFAVGLMITILLCSTNGANTGSNGRPSVCPKIVSKKKWGGIGAKEIVYQIFPVKYVVVHHTVTPRCNTKVKCSSALLNMQNYNINEMGSDDISYNFLISDNAVYEGTGWHIRGSHTYNYNSNSTGIGFIGDFSEEMPTPTAIQLAKDLLQCGVELGELDPNFILLGGRQVIATESPGLELYADLQDWEHWWATP